MEYLYNLINIKEVLNFEVKEKTLKLKVELSNDIFGRKFVLLRIKNIVSDVAVDYNNFHYKLNKLDIEKLGDVVDLLSTSSLDKPNKIQHLNLESVENDDLSVRFNKDEPVLESFPMPDEIFNKKVSIKNNSNKNTINISDVIFNNAPSYVDCYSPLTTLDFGKKIVEAPVNINKLQAERLMKSFSIDSNEKTLIYMGYSSSLDCLNEDFNGFFKKNKIDDFSKYKYNKIYNYIRYLEFNDAYIEIDRDFNITALIECSPYSTYNYIRTPTRYINFSEVC